MKNMFVLIVAPVLLSTLGIAQAPTPTATTPTAAASIIGCLSGSNGAYSVAQDSSTKTLKITSSTVDLKPHIGHQVELTGQKSGAAVLGAPETVSVTAVSMISEHCPMAAASTPAAIDPATANLGAPATPAAPSAPVATAAMTPATPPAATTAPEPVAAAKPAEPSATPVLAGATTPLPNAAAPSLKAVKVTGKLGDDGKTFVSDKDSKSWTVANPDVVKGHEGHHVTLTAHLDTVKSEVEVVSLKMAK